MGMCGRVLGCWALPTSRYRGRSNVTASSTTWRAGTSSAAASPPRTSTTPSPSGCILLANWILFFELTVVAWVAAELYASLGASLIALSLVLALHVVRVAHRVLVERLSTLFRPLQPRYCSIYDPYFWRHERYWKLAMQPSILDGTPFKGLAWRLLGVRIGRRAFDDGCIFMEKTLVAIGDDCALNAGSVIQPHSQEDGTFKSDRIAIAAGCTLGTGALVHYGVTMSDGVGSPPTPSS